MKNPAYKIYIKVIIVQIQISDAIISKGVKFRKSEKSRKSHVPSQNPSTNSAIPEPKSSPPSPDFSRIQITRCKHEIRDATPTHRDQPPPFFFFFIITKEVVER